ncbi:arginine--tRNA ligase [Candidatus Saccharibacteria bacterium]|nr:arginine--tRNA ligase [Candidatus Saccharibacteria bacterium]
MKKDLERELTTVVKELFGVDIAVELTRPEAQHGDYATNVALQLSKQLSKNPRDIAETIATSVKGRSFHVLAAEVAGPGFMNIKLTDEALWGSLHEAPVRPLQGRTIVTEYSDPNPFKVLHAGHFYTSVVGDAISNILQTSGAQVHRVNFGGDVGLHVGKTMWAIVRELGGEHPEKLADIPEAERSEWMARCYVAGTNAYEDDESARGEIIALNKRVYQLHSDSDHDSPFAQLYWTCRQWSYDYFDAFYRQIGSGFERYYPESQTAGVGLAVVKEQLAKGVFAESDGAVIFDGEKFGLHTRVFVNSEGLPTYEAKDVGLSMKKWEDYHFDSSVIITGNDIVEYMKVVLKAIEQFEPNLAQRTRHITHGNVKLAGGVKMSSRKGNFLRAVDVIDEAAAANREATGQENVSTVLAAIKYSFLKNRIGGDIIFDPKESVALEGNSGPYLQYAHARARSILAKYQAPSINDQTNSKSEIPNAYAKAETVILNDSEESFVPEGDLSTPLRSAQDDTLQPDERLLVRKLTEYPEIIEKATTELMPHHICTYLYELAQEFNRFYEKNRVIGDDREALRLGLVETYADTLKAGLELLGIHAPERM